MTESTTSGVGTVDVEGLLVDEETGEILDWPDGITGDKFEWMEHKLDEAQRQKKRWGAIEAVYKSVLGRMLTDMGVKKHGGTQWVNGANIAKVDSDKFVTTVEEMEIPEELRAQYYRQCASAFNAKKVLEVFGDKPGDKGYELVTYDQRRGYVKYETPAHVAPEMSRGTLEEE